ncbi:V-type ATP synthase subunit A [Candidatus Fermentibacteria bacterium]|nr:MAG: V-type ATP synthase subunit A [Candidatus Fermentibacteria bacterium]PIE52339.1 MAG: V-type ATP synthase subunit A [Candidatus Fermentibacteria bacterium]
MLKGRINKIAGPLVVATGMTEAKMYDVVFVSDFRLIGEIIELKGDKASIQVYEETAGLKPGDPVYITGSPLSVELGPGLLQSIYDGIQRPLDKVREQAGDWITRGINIPGLDHEKKWDFNPVMEPGRTVSGGEVIGKVPETELIDHSIMIPPGISGEVTWVIEKGSYNIDTVIARVKKPDGETCELKMYQKWPVRRGRPVSTKLAPDEPLVTGQRVVDAFFPVGKGGTACVPGPFGSGKTVIQHQLAKWADTEVVVYVGCGERGNEMTDVLQEFPELEDPKSGKPLVLKTVLVANTSNMPVAAREASVYTGITIAEYFRDMGYSVALMADSTSRWAEAMREMSGRLEEMPGEEGYPAYLGTRIAEFYERAGKVKCLGDDDRVGALTVVGAVSPAGGDLSDPVVQATLRVVKVFWSLQAELAYKRHFPAIGWLDSYSLYTTNLKEYYDENLGEEWVQMVRKAMALLQDESNLLEIARLVGAESLSPEDQLILHTSKSLREDFLHQNAFHPVDTYASIKKQQLMLATILHTHDEMGRALRADVSPKAVFDFPHTEEIAAMRYLEEKDISGIEELQKKITEAVNEKIRLETA